MNIKQAKDYIRQSVQLYLKKGEFNEYRIPVERQRPIFLLGAPGVGKTAIIEQVSQELGIALVSYSMTHHTRQSALGLPFIQHKVYDGQETDVSEYTMSEIIASVYETMEESGIKEGILFLDEINCVSETLAPSMLQFLQYKVFGRHQVPQGWVIVTAGNPPEYNKAVREFDVAVMDRLKIIEVEADYKIWKEYASDKGLHTAILNFLDMKKEYFYLIENTVRGRSYVTARGWEDLSEILYLYEEEQFPVDETLIGQYLHNDKVVKEFSAYYDLYNKYKRDYRIQNILAGDAEPEAIARAQKASFDERLSLLGMLSDKVLSDMRENIGRGDYLSALLPALKAVKTEDGAGILELLNRQTEARQKQLFSLKRASALSTDDMKCSRRVIRFLSEASKQLLLENPSKEEAFPIIKKKFDQEVRAVQDKTNAISLELHYLFAFVEQAFQDGNEMLILVTELTVNKYSAKFIARFGSEDYQKHNQELMLSDRHMDMSKEIDELLLEL